MANNDREVVEGMQYQGADETITRSIDISAVGSSPSSVAVVAKDVTNGTTVTATVMPSGSPSVAGNVITLPPLTALTPGVEYRVEVKFTAGGNILEHYIRVMGQV